MCVLHLCRYVHSDMQDLEDTLKEAQDARLRLIVTDGVPPCFSAHARPCTLDVLLQESR